MKICKITLLPAALLTALLAASCAPRPEGNPTLETLRSVTSKGGYFFGHQDDLCYGHTWKVEDVKHDKLQRSDVRDACGMYPGVAGFDIAGIELDSDVNIDGVPFTLMRRAMLEHHRRGGLVTVSWHARNPLTGGDAWDVGTAGVVASVLEGGANHDKFMLWLDRAASFFGSLTDSDGKPVPVLFRPWHENVGSWFWWGGKLCSPEEYKALFTLTHDYMVSRGLDNLVWVYSPNGGISPDDYFERYPGDGAVDVLGTDIYQYGELPESREMFIGSVRATLAYIDAYASSHGRLICLSETGFEGVGDPAWWTGTLAPAVEGFPVCYVLVWRNAWDRDTHFYAPYKDSGDAADFAAYSAGKRPRFIKP